MKNVMANMEDAARSDNIIVIEIHGRTGLDLSITDFSVDARMHIPGKPSPLVSIKPKLIESKDKDEMLYFYIVYDLC